MNKRKNKLKDKELIENGKIRLNKFLAEHGIASRRKADELIKNARNNKFDPEIVDLLIKFLNNT